MEDDDEKKMFEHAMHWDDVFEREFDKESDRAAVILTASIFDNSLTELLKTHLTPNASSTDDIFDGANSPLSTFSAKISISHRLGLISSRFSRDLHLLRKIRNEFAHNVHGCAFEDSRVRSRVLELYKDTHARMKTKHRDKFPDGCRGDFMSVASWMLWSLNATIAQCGQLKENELEFGYIIIEDNEESSTE